MNQIIVWAVAEMMKITGGVLYNEEDVHNIIK
jgi:hypothetical protein